MMKKIMLAAVAFSLLSLGAYAQNTPKGDVAVGYAYVHVNGSNGASGANLNGFDASLGYNVSSAFGIVADFGVYHGSPAGVGLTDSTYMFGPRFSFRSNDKFVPFVQALFGGAHVSASAGGITATSNPFAFSFGGGTDIGIAKDGMIALRPQFDYIGLRANGNTSNTERFSVGLVFNFGSK